MEEHNEHFSEAHAVCKVLHAELVDGIATCKNICKSVLQHVDRTKAFDKREAAWRLERQRFDENVGDYLQSLDAFGNFKRLGDEMSKNAKEVRKIEQDFLRTCGGFCCGCAQNLVHIHYFNGLESVTFISVDGLCRVLRFRLAWFTFEIVIRIEICVCDVSCSDWVFHHVLGEIAPV